MKKAGKPPIKLAYDPKEKAWGLLTFCFGRGCRPPVCCDTGILAMSDQGSWHQPCRSSLIAFTLHSGRIYRCITTYINPSKAISNRDSAMVSHTVLLLNLKTNNLKFCFELS